MSALRGNGTLNVGIRFGNSQLDRENPSLY